MRPNLLKALSGTTLSRVFTSYFPMLPFLVQLGINAHGITQPGVLLSAMLFCLGACTLPGLFNFPRWLSAVWLGIFNAFTILVIYAVFVTGDFPNLATCMAALKTDKVEASQMLTATWGYAAVAAGFWLLQLPGYVSLLKKPLKFIFSESRFRFLIILVFVPVSLVPATFNTYPINLGKLIVQVVQYQSASDSVDLTDNYRVWPMSGKKTSDSKELVVFVIGESSQGEYWQILGNKEPTSPAMVRRQTAGELLTFKRHMSTIGATRLAVPAMLSPFADILPSAKGYRPSLVTIMNRAGYQTSWLSVQGPLPPASEAKTTLFTGDMEVMGYPGQYDDRLLGQADVWLNKHKTEPSFMVLHMAGSHIPFEARYPEKFAKWHDYKGKSFPKSQSVGNFQNTILYTDTLLDQLMTRLSQENRPVLLVYVADHGESIMKGYSREHATTESLLHVPFIVWSNKQWKEKYSDKWEALSQKAKANVVTSHLNVVPTLTSVIGLEYEGKPGKRDLLSPAFEPWVKVPAIQLKAMKRVEVTPVP